MKTPIKHLLYTLCGIAIGAGLMFSGAVIAKYVPEEAPAYVDVIPAPEGSYSYPDVAKIYDPYSNIACYVTEAGGYKGYDISCVALK